MLQAKSTRLPSARLRQRRAMQYFTPTPAPGSCADDPDGA